MALIPVQPGDVACVVTTLEMRSRPRPAPLPRSDLDLARWDRPDPARYLALFRRVGAPWLWYSRLVLPPADLLAIVHDPLVEVYAVLDRRGIEVGMLELDFRTAAACEIGYLALVPELTGRGHGRWLMALALARAWGAGIDRVWLHTCSLDHPSALAFYRAQGFTATARTLETFADPRLSGLLPAEAAPQIPCLGALSRR